ncbi:L,D-transpeptidase family protein [Candidatus Woesearchaeota archaeon]|nr:L,D-transpeptidase family protein [Candidatus Woesearchaeota archaeon]
MSTKLLALLTMTVVINTRCYSSVEGILSIDECSCSKDTSYAGSDGDKNSQYAGSNLTKITQQMYTMQADEPFCIEDFIPNESEDNKQDRYYHEGLQLSTLTEEYMKKNSSEKIQKRILIEKSRRILGVYLNTNLLKEYGVSLGEEPEGDKEREGDRKTPVGEFYIAKKKKFTGYHNAFLLSYPSLESAERGLASGLINKRKYEAIEMALNQCKTPPQDTELGGDIEIHGGGGVKDGDWTWGCVGLEDRDIDELAAFVEMGCTGEGTYKTRVVVMP